MSEYNHLTEGLQERGLSATVRSGEHCNLISGRHLTADIAEAAIVNAVNEGGDTDTIGAVAGAVAGARFGAMALPERWLDALAVTDELRSLARELDTFKYDIAR